MIISSSEITLSSSRVFASHSEQKTSARVWRGAPPAGEYDNRTGGASGPEKSSSSLLKADLVEISKAAQSSWFESVSEVNKKDEPAMDSRELFKARLLKALLEKATGKKIEIYLPDNLENAEGKEESRPESGGGTTSPPLLGWGIEVHSLETRAEVEITEFKGQGVVTTADGRRIKFSVTAGMSREWLETSETTIRMGDAARLADPLAISFEGAVTDLTEQKYDFDLNADGEVERISFLQEGAAFLAIDHNGDGTINDGSELFGPTTGDGWAELVRYDKDENGWIDEADSIYSSLKLWSKSAAGEDKVYSLYEKEVGAIYLGNVDTAFDLRDAGNTLEGKVRTSGVYLNEDGSAGVIQQVDLAV